MTIARQAARGKKKKQTARIVDLTGMQVFGPPDGKGTKHFNFLPMNALGRGGIYV